VTPEQSAKNRRLNTELPFFARHAPLVVLPKSGKACPLILNRAQAYAHEKAEKQLADTGKVRAIVVKSRQQGISTYIEARFYHKASRLPGTNAFVMAHLDDATKNIFEMVKRYHDNIHPTMKPATSASNDKELVFSDLDSRYAVATAGSPAAGRSRTNRLFHGSEVAYWNKTDEIRKGAMQTVPTLSGTEIWLESTANGMGNMFHEMAMEALAGRGEYILIFIPWFWMPEYQAPIPGDFELNPEEAEYRELWGLTLEQMAWRRAKIAELKGIFNFKREYPATVHEAFEASGGGLFKPEAISRARKSNIKDKQAPLVLGVDPARGGDRTVFVYRRGREIPHYKVWDPAKGEVMDEMQLVGNIAQAIQRHNLAAVFVDVKDGHGAVDRLLELGYKNVYPVFFGSGAIKDEVYANKRAEMHGEFADWMEGDVSIPDSDDFQKDLSVIPPFKLNSSSRKILPAKEKIIELCGFSPDITDAGCLTFATPVAPEALPRDSKSLKVESSVKTMKRFRKAG
jgi:hypothetical protein